MPETAIEWTHPPGFKGETWNPTLGCSKISPGCKKCYAIRSVNRMAGNPNAKIAIANAGLVVMTGAGLNWTGKINLVRERLSIPLKRKAPTCYFVNSLSDLFHEDIPDNFIDEVFAVMALCPQHRFMILTKRAERKCGYFAKGISHMESRRSVQDVLDSMGRHREADALIDRWPLPNVWLGVSCENQATAHERSAWLRKTPAAVRFISQEPQLSEIHWTPEVLSGIHMIIQGGESGPGSRPFHLRWALETKSDCERAGTAWYFKQAGANLVAHQCGLLAEVHFPGKPQMDYLGNDIYSVHLKNKKGGDLNELPIAIRIRQFPGEQPIIPASQHRSDEFHDPEPEC